MAALPNSRSGSARYDPESLEVPTDQALAALGDPVCRELLGYVADRPRTAAELSEACDLPSTTLYRKLGMLVDGGLVTEGTEIATEGRNATRYRPSVGDLAVRIDSRDGVELEVAAPDDERPPDIERWERLEG